MAGWAGMNAGARVVAVLLGGTAVGGTGYALWKAQQDPVLAEPVAVAAAVDTVAVSAAPAAAVVVAPEAAPAVAPEAAPVVEAVPEPVAPALDVVRVDPDGATLIAGKAGANARVSLRLDGIEEAVTQADSAGNFVAQFTLQANPSPRMLTIAVLLDGGGEVPGDAAVAIAPIATPAVVAAAEPEAPAAIMVTEDAVSIAQEAVPAAPELAANVTIDTIAYAPDGAVLLSGRGQADAGVRLYLDNATVMDAPVGADGKWAVTLPDTAPGIYTLRVDQVAGDGTVSSRFETPFKRETLAALAAAAGQAVAPDAAAEPAVAAVADAVAEPAPEAVVAPAPVAEAVIAALPDAVAEAVVEPAPETVAEAVVEPAPVVVAEAVVAPAAEAVAEAVVEPAPEAIVAPAAEAVAEAVVEPAPVAVAVAEPVAAVSAPAPVTITVQPGFTLWGIADSMMGDGIMYVQVFEMNRDKIRDPDLIYPGQVFMVPQE